MSANEKRPSSMRLRIAVSVTAMVLLLILGQAIALVIMDEELEEEFIDNILAEQLEYSIRASGDREELALPNTPNMRLYRLHPGDPFPDDLPPETAQLPIGNHEVIMDGREFHLAIREAYGARFILRYDESEHETRSRAINALLLSGTLALCLLVLVLVYSLAGRLTRGLESLAARLEQDRHNDTPYAQSGMDRELLAVASALDTAKSHHTQLLAREREFNAHLSHELRTPLAVVRSDAEMIADNSDLPDNVRRRAERIMAGSDRITRLAESLLLLAREANPQLQEEISLFHEIEACRQSLETNMPIILDNRIPPDTVLRTDPTLLQLVLRNLLENAAKHGKGAPVQCDLTEGCLVVRDQGPGLGEGDPERIFERFYQQEPGTGHGLGLTLVRHICQACGWQVSASNHPEGGAQLKVSFGNNLTNSSQPHH